MRFAFLMNLDGAAELARGTEVDPFAALERRPSLRPALDALATEAGVVLARDAGAHGLTGRAFLPTPGALRALARAGAAVPEAPSLDVLRAANHRQRALEIERAASATYCSDAASASACVRALLPTHTLRLKRAFAFAGRGHLRVERDTPLDVVDRFLSRAVALEGGVVIELENEVLAEAAIHGYLSRTGRLTLGRPTVQRTTAGTWTASLVAGRDDLAAREREVLAELARAAARSLTDLGYFGPFGLDAYRYRHGGTEGFRAISDLNARYTMGWAVGMGDSRPDLED